MFFIKINQFHAFFINLLAKELFDTPKQLLLHCLKYVKFLSGISSSIFQTYIFTLKLPQKK